MKRLAIIGAGDLGKLIAHHATYSDEYDVIGFFDDWADNFTKVKGYPVLGNIDAIHSSFTSGVFDVLMVAIGYNHMAVRKSVFSRFSGQIPFATLVHKSCYVDPTAIVGEGCFMLPGCILDAQVVVNSNVLLNTGAVIAHDTSIGSHSFLAPAVAIAGKTDIGESCILGINSTVIDNLTICAAVQVAAGALVKNNITVPGMYAGVPAVLKKAF